VHAPCSRRLKGEPARNSRRAQDRVTPLAVGPGLALINSYSVGCRSPCWEILVSHTAPTSHHATTAGIWINLVHQALSASLGQVEPSIHQCLTTVIINDKTEDRIGLKAHRTSALTNINIFIEQLNDVLYDLGGTVGTDPRKQQHRSSAYSPWQQCKNYRNCPPTLEELKHPYSSLTIRSEFASATRSFAVIALVTRGCHERDSRARYLTVLVYVVR
jgi:hypothetical protein